MGTTSNRSYPYPAGSDAVDVPGDIQALADAVDSDVAAIDANDWVTTARIDDGAVTDAKLAVPKVDQAVVGNLLTANQASIETDLSGITVSGGTIARSTTASLEGSASLLLTRGAGTSFAAFGTSSANYATVVPGQLYQATVSILAASGTPDVLFRVQWFDSSGSATSPAQSGTALVTSSATWQELTVTAAAPANAVRAAIWVYVGTTAGEAIYIDRIGMWQGAGGLWAPPGTPIANLGTRTNPTNSAQVQVWNPGNNTWITV